MRVRAIVTGLIVFALSLPSYGLVSDVSVSGGSFELSSVTFGDPAFTSISTFSTNDTLITLTPQVADSLFGLSVTQQNSTGVDWQGVEFEISGGVFVDEPALTIGLADSANFSSSQASLTFSSVAGNFVFYDLQFSLGDDPVVITVSPIIPEPASAATLLCAAGLLTTRRRRASR